jgi:predicted nucleotidyltransferase
VEEGIVLVRRMPGVDAYELNEAHALTPPLRSLLRFERGLSDELFSFLRSRVKRVAASMSGIYVFGSAARGELTAGSDIDLAVICPEAWAERVRTALEDVAEHTRRRFGNRVSVLVGTRSVEDLVRRGRRGAAIWKRIVQDGIDLLGETAKAGRG